jgi:hypothetical protein
MRQKVFIGGLGALTPIIASLLVVDLRVLSVDITAAAVIAYLVRVILLFYLGGIVAFLHRDENNAVKLFELGIAAPALITGMIAGVQRDIPKNPKSSSAWIQTVHAQSPAAVTVGPFKKFTYPAESLGEQIQRGLFGKMSERVCFVIAGSYLKLEAAGTFAEKYKKKGFDAEVYEPYGDNPYYAVVIGSNLTRKDAMKLRQRAINSGLPKDTYLWSFPDD